MTNVTIFIPISREDHLDKLFASLELLECDRQYTNLFTYVDGDVALFVKARNFTQESKFNQRLCIQRSDNTKPSKFGYQVRRNRISKINNEAKEYLQNCDYIFGLEDDTIPPTNALQKLLRTYSEHPYAGLVSGVQLGRWGLTHCGLWRVDDVYEPTLIESAMPPTDLNATEEVDAAGMYCYLTKRETFEKHEFKPFDNNSFGPDVDFGFSLRREGLKNYVDWSVVTEHRTKDRVISLRNTEPIKVTFTKGEHGWRQTPSL